MLLLPNDSEAPVIPPPASYMSGSSGNNLPILAFCISPSHRALCFYTTSLGGIIPLIHTGKVAGTRLILRAQGSGEHRSWSKQLRNFPFLRTARSLWQEGVINHCLPSGGEV